MSNMLTPFTSPTGMFHDLRREMDSAMRRFFDTGNGGESVDDGALMPRLNLAETEDNFEVTVDLPGIEPENVKVEFRDGGLWITGEYKSETEEEDKTWHRVERSSGQFRRIVGLGQQADPEKIDAEYRDGVLRVTVGKSPELSSKRVAIRH